MARDALIIWAVLVLAMLASFFQYGRTSADPHPFAAFLWGGALGISAWWYVERYRDRSKTRISSRT